MSLKVTELDSNSSDSCYELQPTLSHQDATTGCQARPTAAYSPSELTCTVYLEPRASEGTSAQVRRWRVRVSAGTRVRVGEACARLFKSTVARIMLEFTQVV